MNTASDGPSGPDPSPSDAPGPPGAAGGPGTDVPQHAPGRSAAGQSAEARGARGGFVGSVMDGIKTSGWPVRKALPILALVLLLVCATVVVWVSALQAQVPRNMPFGVTGASPVVTAAQSAKIAGYPISFVNTAYPNEAAAMNAILADVFALYLKTKNFHWHMSGPHFRDYHLMLDEQADQLFAMTDPIAERVRKIGGITIRSIGQIARTQRLLDNDAEYVETLDMLAELADDNKTMAARLRQAQNVCDKHRDVATASLIEN